jgi:putative ABC transport system permease protein
VKLLVLAVKNLTRRKGNSIYIAIAVIIPVAILSTILITLDSADSSLSDVASKFGFTMTIQPKNIKPDSFNEIGVIIDEYIPESVSSTAEGIIKNITKNKKAAVMITPRLYHKTDIRYKSNQINTIIAGINFKNEAGARSSWILENGGWPYSEGETVIGATFAKDNGFSIHDRLSIYNNVFRITGILRLTNSSDDYMVFIPFPVAQEFFDKKGLVSLINIQSVLLDKDKDLRETVLKELNMNIPNIKSLSPQQFSTMKYVMLKKTLKFLLSIAAATVVVSIFSVFNIVTNALYTRVKEIGLLKSVGASRYQLFIIFLYEYSIIGIIGGIAGYFLGLYTSYLLDKFFLEIGTTVSINLQYVFMALFVGIFCSLIASFYPTYKLSSIKVTESFRTQWEV